MSYSQYHWLGNRTWILYEDFRSGISITPIRNPIAHSLYGSTIQNIDCNSHGNRFCLGMATEAKRPSAGYVI